ncbi:MAG: LuxR C-terminal-related transcriptional regulator [Nitriliruptorales bacterium]|nr:LuxR C-terminal-related transcriptional regulator [Nitriliruptorales bacterium]
MPATLLAHGREATERGTWNEAYQALTSGVEREDPTPDDVRLTALAAALTGHFEQAIAYWEDAHRRFLDEADVPGAVRCAFWIGVQLSYRAEHAPAAGWFQRARRLLEETDTECVEEGYLLVPGALGALNSGQPDTALELFRSINEFAERFADPDLTALARLGMGQAHVAMGAPNDGVAMLDEAMAAVTADEVSPLAAGIVYCGVVITCRKAFDLRRAQEWTAALSRWCARQDGLKPYQGQCLVHRSEIMQLRGDWSDALSEIEDACRHLDSVPGDPVRGMARYQQGELLRLRGQFAAAEEAYRDAGEWGHPVQPGLALLRLAQGRTADAETAIRRVMADEGGDDVERARVLSACVEIMLAIEDVAAARSAADDIVTIAERFGTTYLQAVAATAHAAVLLAEGDASSASPEARRAWLGWRELPAPYEAAQARVLVARACLELGDTDTAAMQIDAARTVFEELGAAPALERLAELTDDEDAPPPAGLTPRELEVLRLVATGATNRSIADTLVISERTVDRHVSNIFTKVGVTSRSAATAWAYEHGVT